MAYIFIDAGHGGKDPGAVGFGQYEKNICLKLAKRVNDIFGEYEGVAVSLTRWDDRYLTLSERARMANQRGANLFISLHNNAASASAHGFESFIYTGAGSQTASRQGVIHSHVMNYLKKHGIRDRGKKRANFAVLRETSMTAVLLENLFITNRTEANLLKNSSFIDGLARAIVEGVASIFGLKKKCEPKPEPEPVQKPMYRVTVDGKVIYDTAYHSKLAEAVLDGVNRTANEITLKRIK